MSIGNILDRLMSGEITKEHAVRKLVLNRNREINEAIQKLNKEMYETETNDTSEGDDDETLTK